MLNDSIRERLRVDLADGTSKPTIDPDDLMDYYIEYIPYDQQIQFYDSSIKPFEKLNAKTEVAENNLHSNILDLLKIVLLRIFQANEVNCMGIDLKLDMLSQEVETRIDSYLYFNFKTGIEADLHSYVERYIAQNSKAYQRKCDDEEWREEFIEKYLRKTQHDFSAKDIALRSLRHFALPPIEAMSVGSLEKKIRTLMDTDYKDQVYIKTVQGNKAVRCVRIRVADTIERCEEVRTLIDKQIRKAETMKDGSEAWKQYEREKKYVQMVDALSDTTSEDYLPKLTVSDRMYLMVEALFNQFFTNFDFESLQADIDEYNLLDYNLDFGERYQELYELLHSKNFGWKYYAPRIEEDGEQ